ncbi:MAG: beta-Ala-His dipeptidase, partial [Cyclobacteriaceae bacterium]
MSVRNLEPKVLWNKFADLNAVPRPSKKEERVREFMMDFGKNLGLETFSDEIGNVFIRKPGSKGFEDRPMVVMQSHLDMVHQKKADSDFDFLSQGIDMYVDGDWVKARGTTLGADNGIGVATIMSILESTDIDHPPIEALFTIDEETGMTGALELQGNILKGNILLNLDTEDDRELTIGCAGGVDFTASRNSETEAVPDKMKAFRISIKGLSGGHSGMDIHKGLANANKLMNRLLWKSGEEYGVRIAEISGGGLRNAIPRESTAIVCLPQDKVEE